MKIVIENLNTTRDDIEYITQPLLLFAESYLPKASHHEDLSDGERMTVIFERFDTYIGVTCYYEVLPSHTGEVE